MKACIFTKTKFSVYAPGSRAWRASQLKESDYMEYLFDEERLSFRWHIFKHFSVPTLIKNHEFVDTFFSIIYYSEELPNKWKDKLFSLESKYSFIKVCRDDTGKDREFIKDSLLNNSEQQNNRTTEQHSEGVFCTARLDDDDFLSPHYASSISRYLHREFSGFVVSFPLGYTGIFSQQNGHYSHLRECYWPKLAIGLSRITPYSIVDNKLSYKLVKMGSHTFVDRKQPVILDASQPMYFWSRSTGQDTNVHHKDEDLTGRLKKIYSKMPVAGSDDVTRLFEIPCSDEQF